MLKISITLYSCRKKFHKGKAWVKLKPEDREQVKAGLLQAIISEPEVSVRSAIIQLIGSIAKHELGTGGAGWIQLMQLIQQRVVSAEGEHRVQGVTLISALAEVAGEQVKVNLKDFLGLFRNCLLYTSPRPRDS